MRKVIIANLKLSPAAEAVAQGNDNIGFIKCDVTKWRALQAIITFSEDKFGDITDVYAANAGIVGTSIVKR